MNVAELLEKRREDWQELEDLLDRRNSLIQSRRMTGEDIARFTALYRSACADLALAESYRLPPGVARYLNNLVGRAHNQLYREQSVGWSSLPKLVFDELPRTIFSDGAFWGGMLLFWVPFLVCALLAWQCPDFSVQIVGQETLDRMESMYSQSFTDRSAGERMFMWGFYILNNAGIGLQCFAFGAFFMVPGILVTLSNAIFLGVIFGHMATVPQSANFYEFVTAHGPFELTAIAMSAGAGLRIGFAMISTGGLSRVDAVRKAAKRAAPIAFLAVFFFFCAAMIEAFVSPNPMQVLQEIGINPVDVKRGVALLSGSLLFAYIILLGGVRWFRHISEKRKVKSWKMV
ncbi:MAG: stage II sporulation protein M [Planctomycetaceae bacterium]|nr:stage II sporulation protein M [Planctomycetaceae bacterium]